MFNMLVIALLDFMGGSTPLSARAHQGQVLGAGFGILLLGLVGLGLFASAAVPRIGWISLSSLVFLGVYLIAIERLKPKDENVVNPPNNPIRINVRTF
jgi:cation:H+ antiporter